MFTLINPQLGLVMVNDRLRDAERRRARAGAAHRQQRDRVRASLLLRPESRTAGQPGA